MLHAAQALEKLKPLRLDLACSGGLQEPATGFGLVLAVPETAMSQKGAEFDKGIREGIRIHVL